MTQRNPLTRYGLSLIAFVLIGFTSPSLLRASGFTFADMTDQIGITQPFPIGSSGQPFYAASIGECDPNLNVGNGLEIGCLGLDPLATNGTLHTSLGTNTWVFHEADSTISDLLIMTERPDGKLYVTFLSDGDNGGIASSLEVGTVHNAFPGPEDLTITPTICDASANCDLLNLTANSDTGEETSVPEPGTISMLMLGGMALVGKVRRLR